MFRSRLRHIYLLVGILIIIVFFSLPWTTRSEAKIGEKSANNVGEKSETKVEEKSEAKVGEKLEDKVGEKSEAKVETKDDDSDGDVTIEEVKDEEEELYRHPKNILNVPRTAEKTDNKPKKEETDTEEQGTDEPEEMCPPNAADKFITLENGIIKVDMAGLQAEGWEKLDCRYSPFVRKMDHDISYNPREVIQDTGKKGEISFPFKHEFVRVECRLYTANMTRETIYRLFSQLIRNDKLVTHTVKTKGKPLGVNVFVLCVGSMSQNRFKTQLPQTYGFLSKSLHAWEFPRYHMVGGKTSEALTAAMTGQVEAEMEADIEKQHMGVYKDPYPWLWKEYKEAGYVTLLAEEFPSAWGYDKGAFRNQPTDNYMRPFLVQAKKIFKNEACVGSTPAHQVTLDYTREFTKTYSDGLMFVLSSIHETSRVQRSAHDFAQIDSDIYSLLKFWDAKLLHKTIVVVFSDLGEVVTEGATEDGSMLPFMSIALPKDIEHRYPSIVSNIKVNQNRSTSPFDLHKTLLEVLDYKPKQNGLYSRDNSLFHEIPADRSCRQAGIPKEHCTGKYNIHPEI